jgi:hypothetical protein
MKDIRSTLRAGDPVAREGGASSVASERMRHRIRAERIHDAAPHGRRLFPAVAVTTLLLGAGGAWMTTRALRSQRPPEITAVANAREMRGARQIQFFTPGGTRVLWTLHPKLETR